MSSFAVVKPFFVLLLLVVALEIVMIVTDVEVKVVYPETSESSFLRQAEAPSLFTDPYAFDARKLASKDDDFTYNNPSDKYSPSQFVQYGHKFTGMDFTISMAYGQRLLYAPIVTFGLGFLAIFLTHFGLLCRCCFDCCRCLPNTESVHFERDRFCLTVFYFILSLLVLVIDQLVFLGNQSIDKGVKLFQSDIKSVNNLLTLMTTDSTNLYTYGGTLMNEYTAATNSCQYVKGYGDEIQSFEDSMKSISNSLKSVNDKIGLVDDYINLYAIFYRTIGLYVIWGLAIGCVIFFLLSKFCESIGFTKFTIFISTITYILFIILGIPWLLVTSGGGDLCMAPSYNIIKNIPIDSVKNISLYYATCQGTSVLQTDLQKGINSLLALNDSFTAAERLCPNDQNIKAMENTLDSIDVTAEDLISLFSCPPIQYLWLNIINESFCTNLYEGVFYIWGSQLVTSFLLFILIVVAALLYQYYEVGKVVPQDDVGEDDEGGGDDEERGKVVVVKGKGGGGARDNDDDDDDEDL